MPSIALLELLQQIRSSFILIGIRKIKPIGGQACPQSLFFRVQGGARRASHEEEKRRASYPAIAHASVFPRNLDTSLDISKRKRHHNRRD